MIAVRQDEQHDDVLRENRVLTGVRYRREVLDFGLGQPENDAPHAPDGDRTIRWSCGCTATGSDLDAFAIVPCREHAPEFETSE